MDTLLAGIRSGVAGWVSAALAVLAGGAAGWIATAFRPLPAFLVMGGALGFLAGTRRSDSHGCGSTSFPCPSLLLVPYVGVVVKNFAGAAREAAPVRYLSPNVVKEIVRQKDNAGWVAGRRRMTVLFSDIPRLHLHVGEDGGRRKKW